MNEGKAEYMTPTGPVLVSLSDFEEIKDKVREEEREQCCRDMCPDCARGLPVEYRTSDFYPPSYEHKIDMSHKKPGGYYWRECSAANIRIRLAGNKEGE